LPHTKSGRPTYEVPVRKGSWPAYYQQMLNFSWWNIICVPQNQYAATSIFHIWRVQTMRYSWSYQFNSLYWFQVNKSGHTFHLQEFHPILTLCHGNINFSSYSETLASYYHHIFNMSALWKQIGNHFCISSLKAGNFGQGKQLSDSWGLSDPWSKLYNIV
jgi:hypothetical protein